MVIAGMLAVDADSVLMSVEKDFADLPSSAFTQQLVYSKISNSYAVGG